jgi:hypothetical protein
MRDEPLPLTDRRIASWLFILTAVAYGYFFAGGGWNQNSQFDLTRAIVERRTLQIDAYVANTGDVSAYAGHFYSNKSPGTSFLAAIPYALCYAIEKPLGIDVDDPMVLTLNSYLCTFAVCGLLGALIALLLYRYARSQSPDGQRTTDDGRRNGPVWSATIALTIALGTQLFPYSTTLMAQVPSGALMFLAFLCARNRPLSAGVFGGLAALSNYLCVPALGVIALMGVARASRRRRAAVLLGIGAAPPLLSLAIYQKICCGGFLTTPISTMDRRFVVPRALFGIFRLPDPGAAYGVTISSYRGLFYFAPVLIMAIGGLIVWWRSRREMAQMGAILLIAAIFFGFNVTFNGWEGGFGIGARYLVPLIPLLGLAMLKVRGLLRPLTVALALLSAFLNFAAVAVDPQPSATIPRPMTQYILPLLFTGHFSERVPITAPWSARTFTGHASVNRLAIDEAIPFTRHAPGSPASEWASFNLGEPFFGAGSAMSLLPIVVILVAGAAAIVIRAGTSESMQSRARS